MTISEAQAEALETARVERHIANGDSGELKLLKRNALTGGLEQYDKIERAWEYSDRVYNGAPLPPGVFFELRVSERVLTAERLLGHAAFQHGSSVLQVVQPTPIAPSGDVRFWRFWLTPSETI